MRIKEVDGFVLIMVLAVIHGLIYITLVPPWQHYDEPNHFEFVWLIARKAGIPKPGEVDFDLNRQVMQSMAKHEFFNYLGYIPYVGEDGGEVYIQGISQLGSPPLYYLVAGIPLRFLKLLDVTTELYLVRLASYLMYLITIVLAWMSARIITPDKHLLRLLTPLLVALFPGYTDVMTAVNNDVGAVLLTSLFLVGSLGLVVYGFSIRDLLIILLAAGSGLYTKSTTIASTLSIPFVLLFTFLRNRKAIFAWAVIAVGLVLLVLGLVEYDDAAWWYRSTAQVHPTRVQHSQAVIGDYVFFIDHAAGTTPTWIVPLFQPLSAREIENLKGNEVTLGVWMWADQEDKVRSPILNTSSASYSIDVDLDNQPKFFSFQGFIPADDARIWITLPGPFSPSSPTSKVFYDGLVLVKGLKESSPPPHYLTVDGVTVNWGGELLKNYLRNGSAEKPGMRIRPRFDQMGSNYLGDHTRPSLVLSFLTDWQGAGFLYPITIVRIFRTFIAQFGWGHVSLTAPHAYRYLGIICLCLALGAGFRMIRKRGEMNWAVVFLLLFMVIVTGLAALVRSAIYISLPKIFLPVGRYIYPVMIPIALIFSFGYLEIWRWVSVIIVWTQNLLRKNKKGQEPVQVKQDPDLQIFIFGALLLVLDILSIYSISMYYYL